MANADTPFGLKPVRYLSGAPYNGAANTYSVAAGDGTALYIGDPVKVAGTGQTINGAVYQDVIAAATGDVITGVVVGVVPVTRDSLTYRAASTQRLLLVSDDPNLVYEAQEGSSGTAFTANDIGLNCDFVVAAGSATTGLSGTLLNNATEATSNTLDLRIWGFVNRPDNAIGSSAKWLVRINRHSLANQIAGV
jgi:hypothetical protein